MNKLKYILSILILGIFIFSGTALAASDTAELQNVRVGVTQDKVRIVADTDKEVDYQSFALSSPNRIVIDLNKAKLGKKVAKEIDIDSQYASKVRIGQFDKDTVRIVVESSVKRNNYDVFSVVGGSSNYRVVMDFGNLNGNSSNQNANTNNKNDGITNNQNNNNSGSNNNNSNNNSGNTDSSGVLSGKIITIDPGHGGSDSGAIGPTGLNEKTATLGISLDLAKMLKDSGAKVYITRKTDEDVAPQPATDSEELQARANVANESNSDIFVCIHLDSFTSPSAKGTTGYYFAGSSRSQRLADYIKEGIIEQLGTVDRGTKTANFYVLKHTDMPATLIETAFISNPDEEALLASSEGQQKAAVGIFNGIIRYFQN